MFTAYIVVTVVAAAVNTYAAYVEFMHADWIVANINKYGVPESWLFLLGVLKATAAAGLLVGIGESMTSRSPTVLWTKPMSQSPVSICSSAGRSKTRSRFPPRTLWRSTVRSSYV
jgi:hypothetical protein